VAGPRNALVADLLPRLGFEQVDRAGSEWEYDLAANGPPPSPYIGDVD
jgi:hypothetical protein